MRWFIKYPLYSLLMIVLGVAVQTGLKFYHKHPDALFSFTAPQTIINKPDAVHSRYRGADYAPYTDRVFFQWWNYLIFDGDTRDHFNIIYQLSTFPNASRMNDTASVGYGHLRGATPINAARAEFPLSVAHVSNHFTVDYHVGDDIIYRHTVLNNDQIRIQAHFPAKNSHDAKPVEWDLTFTRTHGFYGALDTEKSNLDMCLMVSTLYGYNSMVSGTIKDGDVTYDIQKNNRFRAYGAGSWGCDLPNGDPPAEYPWTWFWLVIPGVTPDKDISMVFGTAKFQAPAPFYNLYGAYSATGLPGDKIITSQLVRINRGGIFELPISATSNDGYLSSYTVNISNWVTFKDPMGEAEIPLVQIYHVDTEHYTIDVHFNSRVEQYFRAPVIIEKDLKTRVFSDFRAVGVDTKIKIVQKATATTPLTVIYDGEINTMNALEYAYEPNMKKSELRNFGFNLPDDI